MSNLLNTTLTHMTVEDAEHEHKCLEQDMRFKTFMHSEQLAVCGDTLAILKHRLLINAYH